MGELLTSLDVVNQAFKKAMRGYDPVEVDEFLDQVAECLQVYAQKTKDYEREIEANLEKLAEYEKLKDSLQEALVLAQKTAEDRISNATGMADSIVAEARARAEGLVAEAAARAEEIVRKSHEDVVSASGELEKLNAMRAMAFAAFRDLMHQISAAINAAETDGKLNLPDLMQRSAPTIAEPHLPVTPDPSPAMPEAYGESPDTEPARKMGIADTLAALGLNTKFLESDHSNT